MKPGHATLMPLTENAGLSISRFWNISELPKEWDTVLAPQAPEPMDVEMPQPDEVQSDDIKLEEDENGTVESEEPSTVPDELAIDVEEIDRMVTQRVNRGNVFEVSRNNASVAHRSKPNTSRRSSARLARRSSHQTENSRSPSIVRNAIPVPRTTPRNATPLSHPIPPSTPDDAENTTSADGIRVGFVGAYFVCLSTYLSHS